MNPTTLMQALIYNGFVSSTFNIAYILQHNKNKVLIAQKQAIQRITNIL